MREVKLKDLSNQELYDLLKAHRVIPVKYNSTYGAIKQLTDHDLTRENYGRAGNLTRRVWFFSNNPEWDGGWDRVIKKDSFENYGYAWMIEPAQDPAIEYFGDMILFKSLTCYDLIQQ